MKPKTMILMVVAVVCGLGASYMTSRLLAERDEPQSEAPPIEKVALLVPKKNIEMHTPLRGKPEDFFTEKQFVKDENVPKDALTLADLPKLKGKFTKRTLRHGTPVVPEDIMDNFGRLPLPDGMRAMGIPVRPHEIAGGFASLPGSHVDLLWTMRQSGGDGNVSMVLLEDVVVLAADAETTTDGSARVANVVTVALYPDDAVTLTVALENGSVRLIMRNLGDGSSVQNSKGTPGSIIKNGSGKNVKEPTIPVPEVAAKVVEPIPEMKPVTPPPPQPKLTMEPHTVRNGPDYKTFEVWRDDKGKAVAAPQQQVEQQEPPQVGPIPTPTPTPTPAPVPAPKANGNKDDKKKGIDM